MLIGIKNRIYSDYLMKSRLAEYEKFLRYSKKEFTFLPIIDFFNLIKENKLNNSKKYFINRHDIDTDIKTAKNFFELEKKYNIRSTYYFRLSTLDISFIKEINKYGSEVGYHFEEIASYCKKNHIKDKAKVYEHLQSIKNEFINNFRKIEQQIGFKIRSVASHGDFVNRKLGIINNEILLEQKTRVQLGIDVEAYDDILINNFDVYISDRPYPQFYTPLSPFEAIKKYNIICMTSHPRQWAVNWYLNTKDNLIRFKEELFW